MGEIYVFPKDDVTFDGIGYCGALEPIECTLEEIANGLSEVTMVHPADKLGKYLYLKDENILRVDVPVRTPPAITSSVQYVTSAKKKKLKKGASYSQRRLYATESGQLTTSRAYDDDDGKVIELSHGTTRSNIIYRGKNCWIDNSALDTAEIPIAIEGSDTGVEAAAPSWSVQPQLFRIYSVEKSASDMTVRVHAKHISYDLQYTVLFSHTNEEEVNLDTFLATTFWEGAVGPRHDANVYCTLKGNVEVDYRAKDVITALLDQEEGLVPMVGGNLIRDDYNLYIVSGSGTNRGYTIESGKNLIGVTITSDYSKVCTRIIPIGSDEDGNPLYLDDGSGGVGYVDSPLIDDYSFVRAMTLEVSKASVDDDMTEAQAFALMREKAQEEYDKDNSCDKPDINVSIEFAKLGEDERYKQYRELENIFLFDIVNVYYEPLKVNITTQVTRIEFDCVLERMTSVELGRMVDQIVETNVTSIKSSKIAKGAVTSSKIAKGAVKSDNIDDGAVTSSKIRGGAVGGAAIAGGAVSTEKFDGGVNDWVVDIINKTINQPVVANWITTEYNDLKNAVLWAVRKSMDTDAQSVQAAVKNVVKDAISTSGRTIAESIKYYVADQIKSGESSIKSAIKEYVAGQIKSGYTSIADAVDKRIDDKL